MENKKLKLTLSDGSECNIEIDVILPYELDKLPKWIKTLEGYFINKDHIVKVIKV